MVEAAARAALLLKGRIQARGQWLVIFVLVFSDALLAFLVWVAAAYLQNIWGRLSHPEEIAAASIVANTTMWVGLRASFGLYPGYGLGQVEELRRQTLATVATLAVVSVFALAFQVGTLLSRMLLALGFLGLLFFAPLLRTVIKQGIRKAGLWGKRVVILGADDIGARLICTLRREWDLGYVPVGVFDDRLAPTKGILENIPYRGTTNDAVEFAGKLGIDTAIITMSHAEYNHTRFGSHTSTNFRNLITIPDLPGVTTSAVIARDLAGTLAIETKHNLLNPWARRAKRVLDLFAAVVSGLLLSPLLLAIAALIKLDSPGPAIYKQRRPGAGGKYFDCWKFRTMYVDAELLLPGLLESDSNLDTEWGENHKLRDDPRITRIGSFLRKSSLDELPQLWNVLRGEMSLVGPRPMLVEEVTKYGETYELYKQMRPGITGLWQVSGRNDTSYEERVMKVAYYVRNWSVWLDFIILARTLKAAILARGAI
jgi:Undecaprenyl-phosphate galactose phosphotransferase WbaP